MLTKHRLCQRFLRSPVAPRGAVMALWLAVCGAGSLVSAVTAAAQSGTGAPTIEVAAEIKVAPAVVTPLRIRVGGTISKQTMLMVRGVPPRVTLSEGRSFGPGVWMVPLAGVGKLEIAPATGTSGRSDITLELIALDGKILADARTTLTIAPSAAASEAPLNDRLALTAGSLAGKPQVTGALTRDETDHARMLVEKGDASMQSGKITSARLFYQSAAESGWAPAALALGATYDSVELSRSKIIGGIQPDLALARKWYEKAKELGSPEADRRLQQLGGR